MKKIFPLFIFILFFLFAIDNSVAQTVNNGSVTGSPASNSGIGANRAPPWTVCQFSPDLCDPSRPSYVATSQVTAVASPDGGTWLGLAAMSPVGATECAQTTITGLTVGQSYTLYFCAACFGTGSSICNNSPATPSITVGATTQLYTIPMAASTWVSCSLPFTATASTMSLEAKNSSTFGAYYAYAGVDGFSLTTPCGGVLLPIKLLSFNAFAQENYTTKINWQTTEEIDSDHFVLERSEDGLYFYPIYRINAAGNSQELLTYNYIDDELPVRNGIKGGDFYYRLKQVDLNESVYYSKIRVASFVSEKVDVLKIYPNPVMAMLNIEFILGSNDQQQSFQIINGIGQVVVEKELNGTSGFNTAQIDVHSLAQGTYVLQMQTEGGNYHRKFVKK
ncbi:MAG: T9SS type A sorting domain-containing protein [Aureispira sp.]|nr:T9SS type A sorting domain-containing protein [Aureispira sp.]